MAEGLAGQRQFARVVSDPDVFCRLASQPGGHGVRRGEALQLSNKELDGMGAMLPLSVGDLSLAVGQMVYNTPEAAELLGCTRQNVSDLVKRGRPEPVKASRRVTLFLRSYLLAYRQGFTE